MRIIQARCLVGNQVKKRLQTNIKLIAAPANDHRSIGFVKQFITTIKQRFAYIKEAQKESFNIKAALKTILYYLRKQKTTGILAFESHFSCRVITLPSNISTIPKYSALSYHKILDQYLDEETITPTELILE